MSGLKELKNRIGSVKSTQKITKAKQMVAAAKLRRAQEAAEASKPYASRMANVVANLTASMGEGAGGPKLLAGSGDDKVHLLVVMTAERGLCGGFNANTAKAARLKIEELKAAGKEVKIITVGKKGREVLKSAYADTTAIDQATAIYNAIIDDERMSSKLKKKRIKQVLPPAVFVFARYHDVFYYQRTK